MLAKDRLINQIQLAKMIMLNMMIKSIIKTIKNKKKHMPHFHLLNGYIFLNLILFKNLYRYMYKHFLSVFTDSHHYMYCHMNLTE